MVTGSYPPDICGAGDYTARLVEAVRARGVTVEVVTGCDWRVVGVPAILHRINAARPDVVHVQYPTVGYGRKLGLHLVASIRRRSVVTLHEASQSHWLRRVSLYPLLLADHIIFTNNYDLRFVAKLAPWVRRRASVIPIGSNMPTVSGKSDRAIDEIVYFGLIRPKKGLEEVLALAQVLKQRGCRRKLKIIGLPIPEHGNYLADLQMRTQKEGLPIAWELGLNGHAVADRLARAGLAYLPFPDGASERRGSLLSVLASGVATVTTRGAHTTPELDESVEYAESSTEAADVLTALALNRARRQALGDRALLYVSRRAWSVIAEMHLKVYESIVRNRRVQMV